MNRGEISTLRRIVRFEGEGVRGGRGNLVISTQPRDNKYNREGEREGGSWPVGDTLLEERQYR